jgi:hypothetical protein
MCPLFFNEGFLGDLVQKGALRAWIICHLFFHKNHRVAGLYVFESQLGSVDRQAAIICKYFFLILDDFVEGSRNLVVEFSVLGAVCAAQLKEVELEFLSFSRGIAFEHDSKWDGFEGD